MPARSTSVALPIITTPVHGCLAVAVQIYSDNSDGVTGDPQRRRDRRHLDQGRRAAGRHRRSRQRTGRVVAEMPTAGTIWGGSVNPNPTTPVNAVSLIFGFFLRGRPI